MVVPDDERRGLLAATADSIRSCTLCRLHQARTHAVPGEGPVSARILLIGEAPGRDEDATGRPFVGRAGRILNHALEVARIPRDSVFITNVVKCRPPNNRRPKRDEMVSCRPYLDSQIAGVRPQIIGTLGGTALHAVLGGRHDLKRVHGRPLRWGGLVVVPTYHPAGVLYNRRLESVLQNDLRAIARLAKGDARRQPRRASGRTT